MKRTLLFLLMLGNLFNTNSQNLFVSKRDYNAIPYIHSIIRLNQSNGTVLGNYNYTTSFTTSYSPQSLTFNSQTNEIFGLSGNTVSKYNVSSGLESFFVLPTIQSVDYRNIIVANNRLFLTKRDYSSFNALTYVHSLLEINQTNGTVINSYTFTTIFPNGYSPESLTFNTISKEIIGISGRIISKFNIDTNVETSFNLPSLVNIDYGDVIVANNRLFMTKRDYTTPSNYIHSIQEISQSNGALVNSHNFITNFPSSYSPESLTFDSLSGDIVGISDNVIVKYNIVSGNETSFILGLQSSTDYGDIISINSEDVLGVDELLNQYQSLIPMKAFNLLGQEVPINLKNEIIILKYENGYSKKVYNQE